MFLRKIGKAAFGKSTPMQTVLASTLGGMLGFIPGVFLLGLSGAFLQSPGLLLSLAFLLLILNANLAIFGVTLLVAKVLGLLLLPLSFEVGRLLLDGPTAPLFEALVNMPFFAWFGLEYYATTGALLLGLVFGIGLGLVLVRAQGRLRRKLANLETDSDAYKKWTGKRSIRFLAWLLIGAKQGKQSWTELAEQRKKGSPVRIVGVVVVLVMGGGLFFAQSYLAGPAFRSMAQKGLESFNGATVDLAKASVDLAGGKIDLAGLAMADPEALELNVFDARTLDLQIGTKDLLSKRLVVEEITSREAATGSKRTTPGRRLPTTAPPAPPPPKNAEKTIDDYLKDAELWKSRLDQVAKGLKRLIGPPEETAGGTKGEAEQRDRRIDEQIAQLGLARTAAEHLIEGAPMLLIRKVTFEGVLANQLGTKLDLHAKNLSTNPRLVKEPLELSIKSRDKRLSLGLQAAGGQGLRTIFAWKGIPAETIAKLLQISPLKGGTVDLELSGDLDGARPEGLWIDSVLKVTLHGTKLTLPGLPATDIETLTLPVGLRGPLAAPRISIDDKELANALVAAGKKELANQVRSRLGSALGGKAPAGVGGKAGDLIEGKLTPAQLADEAKKKAEAEAKKKAEEELKKQLPGGLFGGKK